MYYKTKNKLRYLGFSILGMAFSLRIAFAAGGIVTDGTVGPAQSLSGANVTILQNLGTTAGKNLFHSFAQFNVNTGQTATFTENTPNALDNVVSRVTGGSQSDIDGTLRSTPGGHANLFLVNPAGVVFGQNARIDVPGAFHASTADEVRFRDGAKFSASQPATSTLTAAAPASFGFLGTSPTTNGLLKVDGAQLAIKPGQTLDMVGGKISVESGAMLSAPTGEVRLEAVGTGEADVPVNAPSNAAHGAVNIDSSTLDASSDGAGKLMVHGGDVNVTQSNLLANNTGNTDAPTGRGVEIKADNLNITASSRIRTNVSGRGRGGDVNITATNGFQINHSTVRSAVLSDAAGQGGNIKVSAKNLSLDGTNYDTAINTQALPGSTGMAGSVDIRVADGLTLRNTAYIFSDVYGDGDAGAVNVFGRAISLDSFASIGADSFAAGKGGNVTINSGDSLKVSNGGYISSDSRSSGDAGSVSVEAQGPVELSNGGLISSVSFGSGTSGKVFINTASALNLIGNETTISADTYGTSNAGSVLVNAGSINIDNASIRSKARLGSSGDAGSITVFSNDTATLRNGGYISSDNYGLGNAGIVSIGLHSALNLSDGSYISSDAFHGEAGSVEVMARSIDIGGLAYIRTDANRGSTGNAGSVKVSTSDALSIHDFGYIRSESYGMGNAGTVAINAKGALVGLSNHGHISTDTNNAGKAGSINLTARSITLDRSEIRSDANEGSAGSAGDVDIASDLELNANNFALISANSAGSGDAGSVKVSAGSIILDSKASISTSPSVIDDSTGNAGHVVIKAAGDITLQNSSIIKADALHQSTKTNAGKVEVDAGGDIQLSSGGGITAVTLGEANAGQISVKGNRITVDGSNSIISSRSFGKGKAGNMTVTSADALNVTNGAAIDASTLGGGGASSMDISAGGLLTVSKGGHIALDNYGGSDVGPAAIKANSLLVDAGYIRLSSFANGNAGNLSIDIDNQARVTNGGYITASTLSEGNGGTLQMSAQDVDIDNGGSVNSDSAPSATGNAGNLMLHDTETLTIGNGGSISAKSGTINTLGQGSGNAGHVNIKTTGSISLNNLGLISTDAYGSGDAGQLHVDAGSLSVNNSSMTSSAISQQSGHGGDFKVDVAGDLSIYRGVIGSSTNSANNAGNVNIKAANLYIDGQNGQAGILSEATGSSKGNAGNIDVDIANALAIHSGGGISSNSAGTGNAGNLLVKAGSLYIDGQGSGVVTGISSQAGPQSGRSGDILLNVADNLSLAKVSQISSDSKGTSKAGNIGVSAGTISLKQDSKISSSTFGPGNAGNIDVSAGNFYIDGQGQQHFTGISSAAVGKESSGDGGSVVLHLNGTLDIANRGAVTTETQSSGKAGQVEIKAGRISAGQSGQISSSTFASGNAGQVRVNADDLSVTQGGFIGSSTVSTGNAGSVNVQAGKLFINGQGRATGISSDAGPGSSGNAGNILVGVSGQLTLANLGMISSQTAGKGNAGIVSVAVQNGLDISAGSAISTSTDGPGNAGAITVSSNTLSIDGQNQSQAATGITGIHSSAIQGSPGNSGDIRITADSVYITRAGAIHADNDTGAGGTIGLTANHLSLNEGGIISTSTQGSGNAGDIVIQDAQDVSIGGVSDKYPVKLPDGQEFQGQASGIYLNTLGSGNGGSLYLRADQLTLDDGGEISAVAGFGSTNATQGGNINIQASTANLTGGALISASTSGAGSAGSVNLNVADSIYISGYFDRILHPNVTNPRVSEFSSISSSASDALNPGSKTLGAGGTITVNTPLLKLDNGGEINVSIQGAKKAGDVIVKTGILSLDNGSRISAEALPGSGGGTGNVDITAWLWLFLNNQSKISIENAGIAADPASVVSGALSVAAPVMTLDGGAITATTSGNVSAGSITVSATKSIVENNGAKITAETNRAGGAGSVKVKTSVLTIDNASISAQAGPNSGGKTGSVEVTAGETLHLSNGGKISIENFGYATDSWQIKAGTLNVSSPFIFLNDSQITTSSTQNISAGTIRVNFAGQLFLGREAFVSTEANNGNGGDITIRGGQLIQLIDSGFKTSVLGQQNGNGGTISVTADSLVMETGLIQANTAAPRASGGDITLNLKALIASGNSLILGGDQPAVWTPYVFGLNVIQAAAPNGISGIIQSTAPQLDLSGVLANLGVPQFDTSAISENYCSLGTGSSLTLRGKGGLLPRSRDSLTY